MKVYITEMLRYGSRENHSYVHSAWSTPELAYAAGEAEAADRGGKYEFEIIEMELDNPHKFAKYIKVFTAPCNAGCESTECKLNTIARG